MVEVTGDNKAESKYNVDFKVIQTIKVLENCSVCHTIVIENMIK